MYTQVTIVRERNGSFRDIIDVEPVTIKFLLHLNIPLLDKRLTADKCARKHICGHFCGMEGNNA